MCSTLVVVVVFTLSLQFIVLLFAAVCSLVMVYNIGVPDVLKGSLYYVQVIHVLLAQDFVVSLCNFIFIDINNMNGLTNFMWASSTN